MIARDIENDSSSRKSTSSEDEDKLHKQIDDLDGRRRITRDGKESFFLRQEMQQQLLLYGS